MSDPSPARLCYAARGNICKLRIYYKITQLMRLYILWFLHVLPANQSTLMAPPPPKGLHTTALNHGCHLNNVTKTSFNLSGKNCVFIITTNVSGRQFISILHVTRGKQIQYHLCASAALLIGNAKNWCPSGYDTRTTEKTLLKYAAIYEVQQHHSVSVRAFVFFATQPDTIKERRESHF
jgi:hypothetical protein